MKTKVLLGILEEITEHAYDIGTSIGDIKADFDEMKDLAYAAITEAEKIGNDNSEKA